MYFNALLRHQCLIHGRMRAWALLAVYDYDVWGNMTRRYGWGGEVEGPNDGSIPYYYSNGKNQRDSFACDSAMLAS